MGLLALRDLCSSALLAFAAVLFVIAIGQPRGVGAADSIAEKAGTCAACHGPGGHSSMTEVPTLAGQPAYYIKLQLNLFRDKQRASARMSPIAESLSDSEVEQLSAYFAALPPSQAPHGQDNDRGKGELLAQAGHCASCHLETDAGQNQTPRLAGQREDYLVKAMKDYRDGKRSRFDGTMTEVLRGFSDQDLVDLAHYFSRLPVRD
jgi:cytochrome c553